MFGERESESPRVPSPWDPFLPSPPNGGGGASPQSNPTLQNGIPKLVPEVEEGNVEYKLKLTQISNARFARLVTQLKWRLLEGGGQAYYELGVADSGALIGLSRADLEASLETLEMMAGEIGASVIVVKEIEVPPTIAALADKESGYTDPDTGEWTRKMRRRPRLGMAGFPPSDSSSSPTSATPEGETDLSTAELTDVDEMGCAALTSTSMTTHTWPNTIVHRHMGSDPARPAAQSSPFIAPIDDDLALFSMEPEPAFREEIADAPADDELEVSLGSRQSSFGGLEIAAVYKPRPVRDGGRARVCVALGGTLGRHGKRYKQHKEKKVQPWHRSKGAKEVEVSSEAKAEQRRMARDKKREEKRKVEETDGVARALVHGVDGLHAALDEVETSVSARELGDSREPRLIVEALVVRKMSIEEATLDFGRLA